MNKRKFIISTGAFLMLVMLFTGYAAAGAVNDGRETPRITEEYRVKALMPKSAARRATALTQEGIIAPG